MEYLYSKYKFSHQIFYKTIYEAKITQSEDFFNVLLNPFVSYSGRYHIVSTMLEDAKRTIFLTVKTNDFPISLKKLNHYPQYFVSISHDRKKAMIFTNDADGIILKT